MIQFEAFGDSKGTKRIWLTGSEKMQTLWIDTLQQAMQSTTGKVVTQTLDIIQMQNVQRALTKVDTQIEYCLALSKLPTVLNLPRAWVQQEALTPRSTPIVSTITQVFKDLARDTVEVNERLYQGSDKNGPENILVAVAQCIIAVSTEHLYEASALQLVRDKYFPPLQSNHFWWRYV